MDIYIICHEVSPWFIVNFVGEISCQTLMQTILKMLKSVVRSRVMTQDQEQLINFKCELSFRQLGQKVQDVKIISGFKNQSKLF